MDTVAHDTLSKPDMVAILERTHLTVDNGGFLLPLFESLSNAIDGVEERFEGMANTDGRISVHFRNLNDPDKFFVSISDNGVGLQAANYKSFRTPYSGLKLRKRGRGFGRFISFKIFDRIHYSSRFALVENQADQHRTFRFDITQPLEIVNTLGTPDFTGYGLRVEFDDPKPEWTTIIEGLTEEAVKQEFGSHFLPKFISKVLPKITIQFDDGDPINIADVFSASFQQFSSSEFTCTIDGVEETLNCSLARIAKSNHYKSHALLFSAAERIVGQSRDLSRKLGVDFFLDRESKKYIVVAVVSGNALEKRLNDARTAIALPSGVVEDIVSEVSNIISSAESDQVIKIKGRQAEILSEVLYQNPILRLGLRGSPLQSYIDAKPNNWKAENFVTDLALHRNRASKDLTKKLTAASNDEEAYSEHFQEIVGLLDEGKKEALAEYVIHRKSIIELIDSARRFDATGKRASEDRVHSLIFRRFSDSHDTDYFEHNLWMIDDALAFLPYVSSDRTTHGGGRQKGDKVTDLLFFDDSMILGDEEGSSLSIVEFKKPSRNDYRFGGAKDDPVTQVIDTLEKALSSGGIATKGGEHFSFSSVVRRTAYIIADLTPSLIKVLKRHDFRADNDPKIFTKYHTQDDGIFIQVFGYDTLIAQAKKRNQAFFAVLLGE